MIHFIGAACGWGAKKVQTEQGPEAFKISDAFQNLKRQIKSCWEGTVYAHQSFRQVGNIAHDEKVKQVLDHNQRLCERVRHVVQHQHFPVVIGGDHACAMGTWSAVTSELKVEGEFGLIWIDAHMDAHTPETSPSGAYHGMPLAHLLGFGHESFCTIGSNKKKLDPKNLCLIGIRSFEKGEKNLLESLGVRIFYMDEVRLKGFKTVFEEALKIATNGTKGFGLSIDLDGFDPSEAPATGSLEAGGLKAKDVLPVLQTLQHNAQFKALEIAEYNPTLEGKGQTEKLMADILKNCLPQKES